MEPLREALSAGMLRRIEKELGREATLRHLWPSVVGAQLAESTQLKSVRSRSLVVAVPDRAWTSSLVPMKQMILSAVNRLIGEEAIEDIEFVEEPQLFPQRKLNPDRPNAEVRSLPGDILESATAITDTDIRKKFEDSARKYLATRREPRS